MSKSIPLGQIETSRLEFKSRDARPIDLAREVVGLLNAGGGEVWWGLSEEGGRAARVEPLEDGEARARDLRNHLIDTIEPSPLIPDEVKIEIVSADPRGDLICIRVQRMAKTRKPAAQVKEQGRRYWLRVGDRLRVMSREEIAAAFRATGDAGEEKARARLLEDRETVRKMNKPCFWMKVVPDPAVELHPTELTSPAFRELLMNPAATGNRSAGWNFVLELREPQLDQRGLRHGYDGQDFVQVHDTGAIEYRVPLDRLHWRGDPGEIWPYALIEFPVSVIRLASKVYAQWGPDVLRVFVDYTFVGLRGWSLRSGSPRHPAPRLLQRRVFGGGDEADSSPAAQDDDLVPARALEFTRQELVDEPDRCGLRTVQRIYAGFGFGPAAIPPEFDQEAGRLVIPRQ